MLKLTFTCSILTFAFAVEKQNELPDRKNVEQLFGSHKYNRRLGKWSTDTDSWASGKKNSKSWSTSDSSDSADDDGMCGCSSYLDDSSGSSSSWSSGKKSSASSWSSGKKSSSSGRDTTSTPSTSNNNETMNFCDCLCSCNNSTTSTSVTVTTDRRRSRSRSRNRRLGKWSTSGDGGCGSSWSSGKKNSASGKKNSASKASGKWSTDTDTSASTTTGEPCFSTTYEAISCECMNTTCSEGSNYMILGPGWEYYLASEDKTIVLTGRYDQDGTQFVYENGGDIAIWWEEVGTDHVFIIGNESNIGYQLYYISHVSKWTNDDNPLTNSDDENEWEASDESAEFITGNITLYDCHGNNLGTDVYTGYSNNYYSSGIKLNYGIGTMIVGVFSLLRFY